MQCLVLAACLPADPPGGGVAGGPVLQRDLQAAAQQVELLQAVVGRLLVEGGPHPGWSALPAPTSTRPHTRLALESQNQTNIRNG